MGDSEDQDDENTLAVQSDARETVEPKSPALRTRGRPARIRNADTREDAGIKQQKAPRAKRKRRT